MSRCRRSSSASSMAFSISRSTLPSRAERVGELWWDEPDAAHIRTRSLRYPGAEDIEPAWTLQAAVDPHRLVRDPDPRSLAGYTRLMVASYVLDRRYLPEAYVDRPEWSAALADFLTHPEHAVFLVLGSSGSGKSWTTNPGPSTLNSETLPSVAA